MRALASALLILVGAFSLYHFSVRAGHRPEDPSVIDWKSRPALSRLGESYPLHALLLAGAVWGLGLGLFLAITGGARYQALSGQDDRGNPLFAKRRKGGAVARIFLLNALLLFTMLALAFAGVRYVPEERQDAIVTSVGLFFGTAALQVAVGLLLLILAIFERPKGVVSLLLGGAVYLAGSGVWVLAFLWGTKT